MKNFYLSLTSRADCINQMDKMLSDNPSQKFYVNITKKEKKRTTQANAQYYAWLPTISNFICEDLKSTRAIIKLDFGLPIVFADLDIGQRYGEALEKCGFFSWSREEQVNHMEFIQVTSLMNTKQHNQMRDSILYYYNQAGLNIGYNDRGK